jgi:hypothetical protein
MRRLHVKYLLDCHGSETIILFALQILVSKGLQKAREGLHTRPPPLGLFWLPPPAMKPPSPAPPWLLYEVVEKLLLYPPYSSHISWCTASLKGDFTHFEGCGGDLMFGGRFVASKSEKTRPWNR